MRRVCLLLAVATALWSCHRDAELIEELTTNARGIIDAALTGDSITVANGVSDAIVERHVYLFVEQERALALAASQNLRRWWHAKSAERDTVVVEFRISVDDRDEFLLVQFVREQARWTLDVLTLPDRDLIRSMGIVDPTPSPAAG